MQAPFPTKFLAFSAHVSPQRIHLQVLDMRPVISSWFFLSSPILLWFTVGEESQPALLSFSLDI